MQADYFPECLVLNTVAPDVQPMTDHRPVARGSASSSVSVGSVRMANGESIALKPPVLGLDTLQDMKRRVALLLGVGLLQVRLVCEGAELSGLTVGDALAGCDQAEVFVVLLSASVYERTVELAIRSGSGLEELDAVSFPSPQGIIINMMPFVLGKIDSLPAEYQHYWSLICSCNLREAEMGKVGYLTIEESEVPAGKPQRRQGLHLETPPVLMRECHTVQVAVTWGRGFRNPRPRLLGGIYTASTEDESCRAWDVRFGRPEGVVGALGSVEHLRDFLGEGTFLENHRLYWMTDTTPHEFVPLKEAGVRQYFRLFTSSVSVWYERHSTANPLGIVPDPTTTRIVMDDQFAELTESHGPRSDQTRHFAGAQARVGAEEDEGAITTIREQLAKQRLFPVKDDPLALGRWVRTQGLQASHLNGRVCQVVAPLSAEGRVGVRVVGFGNKLVRPAHLEALGAEETVKVARLFARGERGSGVQTCYWPRSVLHERACDVSPVSERIDVTLYLTRVEPDRTLVTREDRENRWAARLMSDPETGQVPLSWQSMVGPVVVWRESGEDLSAEDVCVVAGFSAALERGKVGASADGAWMPDNGGPEAFQRFKSRELTEPSDPEQERWWEDVNI